MDLQKTVMVRVAVLGLCFGLSLPTSALANGLGESVPYRFDQKDRLRLLEMQTLKESGFYDAQSGGSLGGGSGSGDTIIHGDQINCIVQSSSMANSNATGLEAVTGSLYGVTDTNVAADATSNESDAHNRGDGTLDIGQENNGNQDANISDSNISSEVGSFGGGGTSGQTVDSFQSADGASLVSTIDDVTVCDGMTIN